ncbi:MAG TPA: PRC-barrel domain-containing protein [Stellaceae bacterium]|jgi:hypothetical protein|nr:PRC-barrel domain-containing protein [Stellaceae bacterium]
MRTIPIAVAALALLGTAASAQTSPGSPGSSPPPRAGATAPATAPAPMPAVNPLTKEDVSNLSGVAVYGSDDAKAGYITAILMDPKTKKLEKFVIASGGVLGIGSHRVALPIDQFNWDSAKAAFKISQDQAKLKEMPEWIEGRNGATGTGSSSPPSKPALPATGAGDSKPGSDSK